MILPSRLSHSSAFRESKIPFFSRWKSVGKKDRNRYALVNFWTFSLECKQWNYHFICSDHSSIKITLNIILYGMFNRNTHKKAFQSCHPHLSTKHIIKKGKIKSVSIVENVICRLSMALILKNCNAIYIDIVNSFQNQLVIIITHL